MVGLRAAAGVELRDHPACGRRDAFYWRKRNGGAYKPADHYRDIEMPKESACGVIIGIAAAVCCFGLIWRIWWMAGPVPGRGRRDRHRPFLHARCHDPHHSRGDGRGGGPTLARPSARCAGRSRATRTVRTQRGARAMDGIGGPQLRHAGLNLGRPSREEPPAGRERRVRLLDLPDERRGAVRAAVRIYGTMLGATVGAPGPAQEFKIGPPSSRRCCCSPPPSPSAWRPSR